MSNFQTLINNHIKNTVNENDRRIMQIGENLLELEPIITSDEITVLNEMFRALKEDYTLLFSQDKITLEPEIIIVKQKLPVIQNKHKLNVLYNILIEEKEINELEKCVLLFFGACEHVEEDEIIMVDRIVELMANNWTLKSIKVRESMGEELRYSTLKLNLEKKLVKSK